MPAIDFIGYYAAIQKAERDRFKDSLKAAAFTAWRMEIAIGSLFGGQANVTYSDYCERMGLLTDEEKRNNQALKDLQKLANRQAARAGAARAEEIMRKDREMMLQKRAAEAKGG